MTPLSTGVVALVCLACRIAQAAHDHRHADAALPAVGLAGAQVEPGSHALLARRVDNCRPAGYTAGCRARLSAKGIGEWRFDSSRPAAPQMLEARAA